MSEKQAQEAPSKSQRKRDATRLQELGAALVELPAAKLATFALPENLLRAIADARGIQAHGGRRRQMQYIGKLMRDVDPGPIEEKLEQIRVGHHTASAHFHRLERLRERLIEDGDEALTELLSDHADLDRQQLRQLVRKARQEREKQQAPRAARQLFRYLRQHLGDGD